MNEKQASPFWRFSLKLYGMPGVPPACLALQERHGVDVNIALFALFAAEQGRSLSMADARALQHATSAWKDDIVVALRGVRVALKNKSYFVEAAAAEGFRQKIKSVELESERLQQEALFAAFPLAALGQAVSGPVARKNLAAYADVLGVDFEASAVDTLVAALERMGAAET